MCRFVDELGGLVVVEGSVCGLRWRRLRGR